MWKKLLVPCSLFAALLVAGTEWIPYAFQSDRNRLAGIQTQEDFSGKSATVIRSLKKPDGKVVEGRADLPLILFKDAEKLILDYNFLPQNPTSRYALIGVTEKGKRAITLVTESNGELKLADGRTWLSAGKIELGKYCHIRYVVHPATARFDLYVNDMTRPRLAGVEFRDRTAAKGLRFYTLGHPEQTSTTAFADIRYQLVPHRNFPAADLSSAPFFIAGVGQVEGTPTESEWQNARLIPLTGSARTKKRTAFRILRDKSNLYCRFECDGKPVDRAPAERDGRLWLGDCVELFLRPDLTKPDYYHFVTNARGERYDAHCGNNTCDKKWNADWQVKIVRQPGGWTADLTIPFATFGGAPSENAMWSCNAGKESIDDGLASWINTNSFHSINNYGKLIFQTTVPAGERLNAAYAELGRREFRLDEKISGIRQMITGVKTVPETIAAQRKMELLRRCDSLQGEIGKLDGFHAALKLNRKADELANEVRLWKGMEELSLLFTPGSAAMRQGYLLRVLPGARQIIPERYTGIGTDKAELLLAGGESAGFTTVLVPAPEHKISKISLNWSTLPQGVRIDSFRMLEISGAEAGMRPLAYLDAMEPGKTFVCRQTPMLLSFYFDITLPRDYKDGKFTADITITPEGMPPATIPVTVIPAGFDLPKTATLDTAFCFVFQWAHQYYGKKPTQEQKKRIWKFIGEHRLEPMNLWGADAGVDDGLIDYCITEANKKMLFLKIDRVEQSRKLAEKHKGKLRPILFGHDEVLGSGTKEEISRMQKAFDRAKRELPGVERLNTAAVDKQLEGFVDIWCPHFTKYRADDAKARTDAGETVWWYPTETPLAPWPNFNLDCPETDARIIPWMTFKLRIPGLLYWALNRESLTNAPIETSYLKQEEINRRQLSWLTPEVIAAWKSGKLMWPERPWLSYLRNVNTKNTIKQCGAGNLIYPGPDYAPWPSVRLKNLRDGMQDYEYLAKLRTLEGKVKNAELRKQIAAALAVDPQVVKSTTDYSKSMERIIAEKQNIARLIAAAEKELAVK